MKSQGISFQTKSGHPANVMPVFKKGDKSLAANYRPISLTCILCKVLEHILASKIVKHLDGQGILYDPPLCSNISIYLSVLGFNYSYTKSEH